MASDQAENHRSSSHEYHSNQTPISTCPPATRAQSTQFSRPPKPSDFPSQLDIYSLSHPSHRPKHPSFSNPTTQPKTQHTRLPSPDPQPENRNKYDSTPRPFSSLLRKPPLPSPLPNQQPLLHNALHLLLAPTPPLPLTLSPTAPFPLPLLLPKVNTRLLVTVINTRLPRRERVARRLRPFLRARGRFRLRVVVAAARWEGGAEGWGEGGVWWVWVGVGGC